jgi:membrane protease YdiL (CAAX protease family)
VQGESNPFSKWLSKPKGSILWLLLAVSISFPTILIFLKHYTLLNSWEIILPWVLIFLINPFMEEFYWRGFLLDKTAHWNKWIAILFSSLLFSANHYVFAIHSELFRGFPVLISTFLMGFIWALVYQKTKSLRWTVIAHFIVDFLNLSVPSFLDLYEKGW